MNHYMKCGHSAMGRNTKTGKPVCSICFALTPDAEIELPSPDLTGRKAKCWDCRKTVDSSISLAFFEYKPKLEFDYYYCGCRGWD